jgi:predicted Rdx family selenoprotein
MFKVYNIMFQMYGLGLKVKMMNKFSIYFAWIYITFCHQLNWIQIRNHMGKSLLMVKQMHQKTLILIRPFPCACGIWFKFGKSCKEVILWTKCKNPSQILLLLNYTNNLYWKFSQFQTQRIWIEFSLII